MVKGLEKGKGTGGAISVLELVYLVVMCLCRCAYRELVGLPYANFYF